MPATHAGSGASRVVAQNLQNCETGAQCCGGLLPGHRRGAQLHVERAEVLRGVRQVHDVQRLLRRAERHPVHQRSVLAVQAFLAALNGSLSGRIGVADKRERWATSMPTSSEEN